MYLFKTWAMLQKKADLHNKKILIYVITRVFKCLNILFSTSQISTKVYTKLSKSIFVFTNTCNPFLYTSRVISSTENDSSELCKEEIEHITFKQFIE